MIYMKKEIKDPRSTLVFFWRASLITLIGILIIFFNIKTSSINKMFLVFGFYIFISLLIRKFYPRETNEYKLHNIIGAGYAFSAIWFIIALAIIKIISDDYIKLKVIPSVEVLGGICILLFFGIILFYLANKSRKYEKEKSK